MAPAKSNTSPPAFLATLISCLIVIFVATTTPAEQRGFRNSPHDFTNKAQDSNSWNSAANACIACHVPHEASRNKYSSGLQWNHAMSNETYMTYKSVAGVVAPQPSGNSKLCLGCHDGTIAIDDFKGSTSNRTTYISDYSPDFQIPGALSQVNDLRRTHPINVTYNYDPNNKDGLRNPSSRIGYNETISDVLENGKVVCSSCHDVHNNESAPGSPLLRAPMTVSQGAASGLCLACHKK